MITDTHGQTEYEILTRKGIPLVLGEKTWRVKPRTMHGDQDWLALVQEKIVALVGAFTVFDSIADIIKSLGSAAPDMLALIFEYDLTGQLDRQWIDGNVETREITTAFTTLCEEAYPPFAVSRRLLPADRAAEIIGKLITWAIDAVLLRSPSPEPTSSPSTNGTSARPKRSKTA